MNWTIKIISKTLMTKISHISWGGYDKGFYGNKINMIQDGILYTSSRLVGTSVEDSVISSLVEVFCHYCWAIVVHY